MSAAPISALTLDEHLDGRDDAEYAEPRDRVEVDRLLGALRRVRARREADRALAKVRAEQIGEWLAEREQGYEGTERHLIALCQSWHAAMLRDDPKAKSVSLPNGVLKSRASAARIEVVDEIEFVVWCHRHRPDLLREKVTHSPDRKKVAHELRTAESQIGPVVVDPETGEAVPGVAPKPAGRTFSVETFEDEEQAG